MPTDTKTPPTLIELYPAYFAHLDKMRDEKRKEFLSPFFKKIVKEFKKALALN